MITYIEEEFNKIIEPISNRQDNSRSSSACNLNLNIISSRDRIYLINNLKLFIKLNISNPSLSIVFTKLLSTIFSEILFKCLDDFDQNVRIAADECINEIICLTSHSYSQYIIYNVFVELENNLSPRCIIGAFQKFSALCHQIKQGKRQSYVNKILPILQVLITRSEESVLLCLVDSLPRIAATLFVLETNAVMESSLLVPIIHCLLSSDVVANQRSLAQLVAITCAHVKDRDKSLSRLWLHCVSADYNHHHTLRGTLFLIKSLLTMFLDTADSSELMLIVLRLVAVLQCESTTADNENLALDCLWHLLQVTHSVQLSRFFSEARPPVMTHWHQLRQIEQKSVTDATESPLIVADDSGHESLHSFLDWPHSPLRYFVRLIILNYISDHIEEHSPLSVPKKKRSRVNSRVLAINCLSQISLLDYHALIDSHTVIEDTCDLPSAVDCVLFHCKNEDSQLSGSAVLFIGQVIASQLAQTRTHNTNEPNITYVSLVATIQALLDNPISSQHLKFVLSALKLFMWDLSSLTEHGELVVTMMESVLQFADHNYKLVRREVAYVCRCVDFRSISYLEQCTKTRGLFKKTLLSERCISTVLTLLADVEQDVREEACTSFHYLIENGAFDDHCCSENYGNLCCQDITRQKALSVDGRRLIPFLCTDINICLTDVRNKLQDRPRAWYFDHFSAIHRSFQVIIDELISCSVPSSKEMKKSFNYISGCVSVLITFLEKYPISTNPQLWLGYVNRNITSSPSTSTRTCLNFCSSLLSTPLVMTDMILHTDILHLISRLILHGSLEHLLRNDFFTDKISLKSERESLHINTDLPLVESLKQFMVHLSRILNVFWHVLQFMTPLMPVETSTNSPKKKAMGSSKGSIAAELSQDSIPPRSQSCLGFFSNQPHYMLMFNSLTVAYNSFILSSHSTNGSDKLILFLSKSLESLGIIMEILTFNEVSNCVEEFLCYCSVFYNIVPIATVKLMTKLLGSLFGTNLSAQWDPILSRIFSITVTENENIESFNDISQFQIDQWQKMSTTFRAERQLHLNNASISSKGSGDVSDVSDWNADFPDIYLWLKAIGKKRKPRIPRQLVLENSESGLGASQLIGLFEKQIFLCMRHYTASSSEIQISIIQFLSQVIRIGVNYCQLDLEQKFLKIILNQLESLIADYTDTETKSSLIIQITSFLILLTSKMSGPNKRDQPILGLSQVILSIESMFLNDANIQSVIMPCLWEIVCDLFVFRPMWLYNPGSGNILPGSDAKLEIEKQRETIFDLILSKLLKYPETLDMLTLIVECHVWENELKWNTVSEQIWIKVSSVLLADQIEFTEPEHINQLLGLIRVICFESFTPQQLVDFVLKYEDISLLETDTQHNVIVIKYRSHIIQSVRAVVSLSIIVLRNIVYDEICTEQIFICQVFSILRSLAMFHSVMVNNRGTRGTSTGSKLIRMLLLILIDLKQRQYSWIVPIETLNNMDHYFRQLKKCELDIELLWDELNYVYYSYKCPVVNIRSPLVQQILTYNKVIQICRHVNKMDEHSLSSCLPRIISEHYVMLIQASRKTHVQQILDVISTNQGLSTCFVHTFMNHSVQIGMSTDLLMRWLSIIEKLHCQCSRDIVSLLRDYVVSNRHRVSLIVLMKIDVVLCSRLDLISGFDNDTCLLLEEMITKNVLSFSKVKLKLKIIRHSRHEHSLMDSYTIDPVTIIDNNNILSEKLFWRLCVERSLVNYDLDIRLGPRLLQGGAQSDIDDIFNVDIASIESESKIDSGSKPAADIKRILKLPPRFIQQCLKLGFMRSSGGGSRVDFIFRLGEKLIFEELSNMINVTNNGLLQHDTTVLDSPHLLGLLAALHVYLRLGCQLPTPILVFSVNGHHIISLLESICSLLLLSQRLLSRIMLEEVLALIIVCLSPTGMLTEDGIKDFGKDLSWSYVTKIVDFLDVIMKQFTRFRLKEIKQYPREDTLSSNVVTVVKLNQMLSVVLDGQLNDKSSVFQEKLKLALTTVVRLPLVIGFSINPNNIKTFDVDKIETIMNNPDHRWVLELDCLSTMNRDDLTSALTLFGHIGWNSRLMFEETWLIYLNLLHDKGPRITLTDNAGTNIPLASEEVVEQGHCDSLGLLGLTNMLLKTTSRLSPGNPSIAQLDHKPRHRTPKLMRTKLGKKLATLHYQLDEEIFRSHRGCRIMLADWTILCWNVEREESVLQYRHDQINIDVLARRISSESHNPQIHGLDKHLDVFSCLQSMPMIYDQWLRVQILDDTAMSGALWPRTCALRSAVILMDLFSTREQFKWLFDCLLELSENINIEDDWIYLSWMCIGLSKCVAVLESSSNLTLPPNTGRSQNQISTNSIYGLLSTIKIIDFCLDSDLTILQQSALQAVMFLLQMTVYGKVTWDLPKGSLVELKDLHDSAVNYLEDQIVMVDRYLFQNTTIRKFSDVSNSGSFVSKAISAAGYGSVSLSSNQSENGLPRLVGTKQKVFIRSERHDHLIMAAACFYCETYQDTLLESDLLNNFVTLAMKIMQTDKAMYNSSTTLLILCRCLERCLLTERVSVLVVEQLIRLCSYYLRTCQSTIHTLPVLRLFLTSCYISLANSVRSNPVSGVLESAFFNGSSYSNCDYELVMLERINVLWKRLTDTGARDVAESRILSRLISNIMIEFMSGEEKLNKTVHQLLQCWPRAHYVAKTLFDIVTRCLNQPEGEKVIRKWTIMVLPSLASCRPASLSVWMTTIVLVATSSPSRISLRTTYSQCLNWLTKFESESDIFPEIETCLFIASLAFIKDLSRDRTTVLEYQKSFLKAIHNNRNIPTFEKLYDICRQQKLV